MAFVILRSTEYRRMRWKNGLGETAEVAIAPVGAALDAFDWRISMARVESDGPFSAFAGVDRTLTILQGAGLWLSSAGEDAALLALDSAPYSFPGDVSSQATLADGAITDLNVMTRRQRCWHRVRRVGIETIRAAPDSNETFLVVPGDAAVTLRIDGVEAILSPFDSVRLGAGSWCVDVSSAADGALLLVEIGARGD